MTDELLIRPAMESDLASVLRIYRDASKRIGRLGIDQWQNNYPNESSFRADLGFSEVYAAEMDGRVCAVMTVSFRGEPTYSVIKGNWSADAKYAVVHRIAVAEDALRQGIGRKLLRWVYEQTAMEGAQFVRIDTHEGNVPMRRFLQSEGFRLCGVIRLANGDERLAYDKSI